MASATYVAHGVDHGGVDKDVFELDGGEVDAPG